MPIVLNFNGTRITDAIIESLSASKEAYIAAVPGALVPVTTAEFNLIAANLQGVVRTGVSESGFAAFGTQQSWPGVVRNVAHGTFGTALAAGYVLGLKSLNTQANVAVTSSIQLGYGLSNTSVGVAVSNLTTTTNTADSNKFLHWIIRSPSGVAPAGALPTVFTTAIISTYSNTLAGTTQATLQPNGSGTPPAGTTVVNAPTSTGSPSLNAYQFLQTPTLQWG